MTIKISQTFDSGAIDVVGADTTGHLALFESKNPFTPHPIADPQVVHNWDVSGPSGTGTGAGLRLWTTTARLDGEEYIIDGSRKSEKSSLDRS